MQFATEISLDLLLAIFTAIGGVYIFIRRYKEESKRNRLVQLSSKSIEFIFGARNEIIKQLNIIEDLPDITDDETAGQFHTSIRQCRRIYRQKVFEHLLFIGFDNYQKHLKAYQDADEHYINFVGGLKQRKVDYSLINMFKSSLYSLLEDLENKIIVSYEEAGIDKTKEKSALKDRYDLLRNDINQINASSANKAN